MQDKNPFPPQDVLSIAQSLGAAFPSEGPPAGGYLVVIAVKDGMVRGAVMDYAESFEGTARTFTEDELDEDRPVRAGMGVTLRAKSASTYLAGGGGKK